MVCAVTLDLRSPIVFYIFRVASGAVTLDLGSLTVFCILRVAPLTGKEVSWFVLSPLISVDTLCFASEG